MPQPGINGMEPVFGKAYGSHRCLLTSGQFAISPLEGRTEHDQETPKGVVQMLGSPAVPRKRPFELLSDLLDDGFSEDLHHERWDISALDDITHYTKVDLEGEPVSSDGNVMKRRSSTEEPPERASDLGRVQSQSSCDPHRPTDRSGSAGVLKSEAAGEPETPCRKVIPSNSTAGSMDPSSPSALEHRSEEHNYSLHVDRDSGTSQGSDSETEDTEEEDEGGEAEEEIAEDKDSSFSESECDPESESQASTRPTKRQCFWECSHSYKAGSKREMGKVPHSWKSHTLPSTLYLREEASANGKICPRKARKTDASDLTPNPQKLQSIGDQLHKLNMAIEGMRPVNDLPIVARVRSRKEKNKLASRACRLKKKAQHEANKIKLWGLNQEYDSLLGVLLRIKGIIRRRVESREEDHGTGMMKQLEEILRESSGPCVAGRTKEFVESILEQSAGGQRAKRPQKRDPTV